MKKNINRRSLLAGGAAAAIALGFNRPAMAGEDAITQTAELGLDPARKDDAIALLKTLTAAVEEKEPGVLTYLAHIPSEDPSKIFFFEVYANAEALANHGQQPHMAKLREAFQSGILKPPVNIVKLDAVGGFSR